MKQCYRVQDFTGSSPMLVASMMKLKDLLSIISTKTEHKDNKFTIFYHWKQLELKDDQELTLKQIVARDPINGPVFFICDDVSEEEINPQYKEIFEELKEHLYVDQKQKKSHWYGSNGHMILDNRNLGLLASSIKHAAVQQDFQKLHGKEIGNQLKQSLVYDETEEQKKIAKIKQQSPTPGVFTRFLTKIGLMKQKPTHQNLYATVSALKKIQPGSQDNYPLNHPDYKYSNFDPKFMTYLERVYLKFAIISSFKLHYVDYKQWTFGIIKKKLPNNCKIGLIGDYGTGLADSIKLLEHMIIMKKVDVIIHLGDVYYAGTPQEYENNILKPLKELRIRVQRQIIFYSIPGNHDYYSWGLPFLCFIKEVNQDVFVRQEASYFCLRNEDDTWQFLGADTAYHDSDPADQISLTGMGPRLRHKEMSWHREKLENFPGSTIFLSHHQLFSIHDRISGSLSAYRNFSCINPLLSSQLFEYLPYFSCWYWGHEHSFMLFADNILGANRCRLLGNSSFHVVFDQQHPYERKKSFPYIPFIVNDKQYLQKYLPLSPNKKELYFNLTYGFIDMAVSSKDGLNVEYYCCPSFQQQDKNQKQFQPYLLYKQVIESRDKIKQRYAVIKNHSRVYIKMETGLILTYDQKAINVNTFSKEKAILEKNMVSFDLIGRPFLVQFDKSIQQEVLRDESQIYIKTQKEYLYISMNPTSNKIYLTPQKTPNALWKIKKNYVMRDESLEIRYRNTIKLQHANTGFFMSWRMEQPPVIIGGRGKIGEAVFMFLEQSLVQSQQSQFL